MDKKTQLAELDEQMTAIIEKQDALLRAAKAANRAQTPPERREWDDLENEFAALGEKRSRLRDEFELVEKTEARESERRRLCQLEGVEYRESDYTSATRPSPRSGEQQIKQNRSTTMKEYATYEKTDDYRFSEAGTTTRDAFNKYLRFGINTLKSDEVRALQGDKDSAGGFLMVPTQVADQVFGDLDNSVFIRQYARIIQLEGAESFRLPWRENDLGDLTFTSELKTGSEDSSLDFAARDLHPHSLARRIKVSNDLMRMSRVNPESIVRERMTYKLSTVLENAYLNGSGSNEPLGVFQVSANGISTARDVSTGALATSVTADHLINCVAALKAQYRRGARWLISRSLEGQIRRLKTGDGAFMWQPSLTQGQPSTLLGFPVDCSEYCPSTFSASQYVGILANWGEGYFIGDAMAIEIARLTELYAETNQTGFIIRFKTDGLPYNENAFVRIKLAP